MPVIEITPDVLRSMASWMIAQCVIGRAGLGGFMTFGLLNLVTYTLNPHVDYAAPYRKVFEAIHLPIRAMALMTDIVVKHPPRGL